MSPTIVQQAIPRLCRSPRCGASVLFDVRVNELREWCSDEHMMAAIAHHVEKPCKACRVWPRRNGYMFRSENVCGFKYR